MKSLRRFVRRQETSSSRRRKSFLQAGFQRRILRAEQLEGRQMMAGDLDLGEQNRINPFDTDANGTFTPADILHVINQLNDASAGKSTAPGKFKNDVNGDGLVSPIDALNGINEYNARAEGEGGLVKYTTLLNQTGTNNALPASIAKGTDYDIVVNVEDLRVDGGVTGSPDGVFTGFLDLLYDKRFSQVEIEEVQTIQITNSPSGGTFTLSLDGQTTGNITFAGTSGAAPFTTATNIQTALAGLSNVGAGNVEVTPVNSGGLPLSNQFTVRFQGGAAEKDWPLLVGNPGSLTPVNANRTIRATETFKGLYQVAFQSLVFTNDAANGKSPPLSGTFTLTFNGQTTAPITYVNGGETATATNIKTALGGLSGIGAANIEVTPVQTGSALSFIVLFKNNLNAPGLPLMTSDVSGLTPNGAGVIELKIESSSTGLYTRSFLGAMRFSDVYANNRAASDGQFNEVPFPMQAPFADDVNRISDVGATAGTATLGPDIKELFRVRMNTLDATTTDKIASGNATITGNVVEVVRPAHDTLVYGSSHDFPVAAADIELANPAAFVITETFSAINDTITLTEDPGLPFTTLSVMGNDVNVASGVTIQSISTTNVGFGTISIAPDSKSIRLVATANASGSAIFTYKLVGPGGVTDTATVTLTLTPQNDSPINNSVPAAAATDEGTNLVINGINVTDVDVSPAQVVRFTLSANVGTIALATVSGLTSITGGSGTSSMVYEGVLADVNAALAAITYTPVGETGGTATITLISDDKGNSGAGGAKTDTDNIAVTINSVNDAPVVNVPAAQTTDETFPLVFSSANGNAITITDVDVDDPNSTVSGANKNKVQVTLNIGLGTLTLGSTTGLTSLSGNGTNSISFFASRANANAALNGLSYGTVLGEAGVRDLTVGVNDLGNSGSGGAKSDSKAVNITVVAINRPFAVADNATRGSIPAEYTFAEESGPHLLHVLANDFIDAGETSFITGFSAVSPSGAGTVIETLDGGVEVLQFTPALDFFGTVTFTYTMNQTDNLMDGPEADSTATVTLTVTNVNDNPTATNQNQTVLEDIATPISLNVGDVDNEPLTITILTPPANGTITNINNAARTITYKTNQDSNLADSIVYKVSDGHGGVDATATISITVTPQNDAPVAVNDPNYSVNEDTLLTIGTAAGVRNSNDSDVDNATTSLNVILVSGPSNALAGSFSLNSDGSFTYQGALNFNGTDSFTYKLNDGNLDSNVATVTITVNPVNDAPVAVDDNFYTVNEDTLLTVPGVLALPRVRNNDTDVDNTTAQLTVTLVAGPTNAKPGSFALNSDGSFTYQGSQDFNGQDSFTYTVKDPSNAVSNTATVTITVTAQNDPPVANPDSYPAVEDQLLTVPVGTGVRNSNDTDPDTAISALTVTLVSGPAHARPGTFALASDGSFTYQGAQDYNGPDSFTYKLNDGNAESGTTTVSITVGEVNDPPTAVDDGTPTRITMIRNFDDQVINVLLNDSIAPDGNQETNANLTIIKVNGVAGPATTVFGNEVRIAPNGKTILFNENTGVDGDDQFTYTISDGRGGEATATVFVRVVNFIPTDISGRIWMDTDNDGIFDFTDNNHNGVFDLGDVAIERPLAGAEVELSGHDDIFNIDYIEGVNGLMATTDINGYYIFDDVKPGSYVVYEHQVEFTRDGKDTPGNVGTSLGVNSDRIAINLPLLGIAGGVKNTNFAERGLDPNMVSYDSILASSNGNGLILAIGSSQDLWQTALPGWTNLKKVSITLSPDTSHATLYFTDLRDNVSGPITISQSGTPSFSLMANSNGSILIHISGSAADFGLTLLPAL